MDTRILPASEAQGHRPPVAGHERFTRVPTPVGTDHKSPVTLPKLFSFTHFRKNASATPFVSHTFKTKDLKPFRFTHFQKNGRGWVPLSNLRSSLSPLDSALTSK